MKKIIEDIIAKLDKNPPPGESAYLYFMNKIDFKADEDFILFIKEYNGAEGFLNEDTFVLFWNIDDIIALNPYYVEIQDCDSLFFFGNNGSNLGYAFDIKKEILLQLIFWKFPKELLK